jgi:List-Bact-rpt repeat protein
MTLRPLSFLKLLGVCLIIVAGLSRPLDALAAQLTLSWTDNSTNEDGFSIERKTGTTGTYAIVATVGTNVTSFVDTTLSDNTTYCYRVQDFNSAGLSSYSNEACGTTPVGTTTTAVLTITKSGTGSGTVTSNPAAINCGATCTGTYTTGAIVGLIATASAGSVFSGWSGDADCTDGNVTMNVGKTCTATFQLQTQTFALSATVVKTVTTAGTGNGTITSNPTGINCGTTCSANYNSGTSVALTATAATGSSFTGWSGACTGTGSCSVSMTVNRSVTATFAPQTYVLSVKKTGRGTVGSSSKIQCGTTCSETDPSGTFVTLTATADPRATFLGWSGACVGTGSCTVTLSANTSVTANFSSTSSTIGVYRPSTGEWLLDTNGNGTYDGCTSDTCDGPFGDEADVPVPANWTAGQALMGVFDKTTATWYIDQNGNGTLDACGVDTCPFVYGQAGDIPVAGDWTGNGTMRVGVFRPSNHQWYFDINGDHNIQTCKIDACAKSFGVSTDIPIVGDWTGSGKTRIGIFRPSTQHWILDINGDRKIGKGCKGDQCILSFGLPGDVPVVGDWNGSGADEIGVYRPSTGEWFLDYNGNGIFDGCGIDLCGTFGQPGDLPTVAKW